MASDERIEACILYKKDGEIVSLRTFVEDGGARLRQLLARLRAEGMRTFRFPKVHPAEISKELLETLGFRPAGGHLSTHRRRRPARSALAAMLTEEVSEREATNGEQHSSCFSRVAVDRGASLCPGRRDDLRRRGVPGVRRAAHPPAIGAVAAGRRRDRFGQSRRSPPREAWSSAARWRSRPACSASRGASIQRRWDSI